MELLATSFQASFYSADPLKIVVRLTYSMLTIGISAMLFRSGLAVLKKADKESMRTRGTKLMMAASVAMIIYALVMLLVVFGEFSSPQFYVVSYTLLFLSLHVIGTMQVAAFDPHRTTKSGATGFSTSKKSTSPKATSAFSTPSGEELPSRSVSEASEHSDETAATAADAEGEQS